MGRMRLILGSTHLRRLALSALAYQSFLENSLLPSALHTWSEALLDPIDGRNNVIALANPFRSPVAGWVFLPVHIIVLAGKKIVSDLPLTAWELVGALVVALGVNFRLQFSISRAAVNNNGGLEKMRVGIEQLQDHLKHSIGSSYPNADGEAEPEPEDGEFDEDGDNGKDGKEWQSKATKDKLLKRIESLEDSLNSALKAQQPINKVKAGYEDDKDEQEPRLNDDAKDANNVSQNRHHRRSGSSTRNQEALVRSHTRMTPETDVADRRMHSKRFSAAQYSRSNRYQRSASAAYDDDALQPTVMALLAVLGLLLT